IRQPAQLQASWRAGAVDSGQRRLSCRSDEGRHRRPWSTLRIGRGDRVDRRDRRAGRAQLHPPRPDAPPAGAGAPPVREHCHRAAIAVAGAALAAWVVLPQSGTTGTIALLAAALQSVRLARWAGDRTRGDWLVLVLHLAYAFVPLGFLLIGIEAFVPAGTMTG